MTSAYKDIPTYFPHNSMQKTTRTYVDKKETKFNSMASKFTNYYSPDENENALIREDLLIINYIA